MGVKVSLGKHIPGGTANARHQAPRALLRAILFAHWGGPALVEGGIQFGRRSVEGRRLLIRGIRRFADVVQGGGAVDFRFASAQ